MEDSQVLDAESKAAPLQAPEAIIQTTAAQQPTNVAPNKSIYSAGPVGEKDHAAEVVNNINKSNYNYNSAVDASKDPTVQTQSTTRHNVTPVQEWETEYTMDKQFKMDSKCHVWRISPLDGNTLQKWKIS